MDEMPRQRREPHIELLVMLALLRLGDGGYGVPILREIEKRTRRRVAVASVYAVLNRLEERRWVSSRLGEPTPERGGRAKRYFTITSKGLRELQEAQGDFVRMWRGLPQLKGVGV